MQILENVSLTEHSTMRLGGNARYLCTVENRRDVSEAVAWAIEHQVPPIMIGGGSNIIWRDEGFDGLVIVNAIRGYEDYAEDDLNHYLTVGSGEIWDEVVARSVEAGLTGIEALSLVPGTAGATPVQNVGAYGQEIAQTLVSVEAYDLTVQNFVTIPAGDCQFSYRHSRFNTVDRGRFLITGLTLHLLKQAPEPPFYNSVTQYLSDHNIAQPTPADIRTAVIDIRRHKLPDPAEVANCGSFFGNAIVDETTAHSLEEDYPGMPQLPADQSGMVKIPAAWLIEQAGFKNFTDNVTGMATWPAQPLVLINQHAKSTADLLAFKQKIVDTVASKFQITLQQEPELLP